MLLISIPLYNCVILQKGTFCTSNFDQSVETLALSLFFFNNRNISNLLVNNSIPVPLQLDITHFSLIFIIFSIFVKLSGF